MRGAGKQHQRPQQAAAPPRTSLLGRPLTVCEKIRSMGKVMPAIWRRMASVKRAWGAGWKTGGAVSADAPGWHRTVVHELECAWPSISFCPSHHVPQLVRFPLPLHAHILACLVVTMYTSCCCISACMASATPG